MSSRKVNYDALIITPAAAVGIPVTDINHVVREINRMRKASSRLNRKRQRQRDIQHELRLITTNKRENK